MNDVPSENPLQAPRSCQTILVSYPDASFRKKEARHLFIALAQMRILV